MGSLQRAAVVRVVLVECGAGTCGQCAALSVPVVVMGDDGLSIYTVYNSPSDYPGQFVVRRFAIDDAKGPLACEVVAIGETLNEVRATLLARAGPLHRLPRWAGDDANIVEVWL